MAGKIIKTCKKYNETAESITWNATNGNIELTTTKKISMKGENGGVKFTKKGK
ncbi:hypothetical protein ACFSTE_02560 [Aquimarina hainanensis]|uniref:Hypervirulence associated protein TUDOR domain-containing protein n=1 Tax=Aquimarina hainanensis TaxID=1578017 RepID=A0ABW5N3L6_9FLAO